MANPTVYKGFKPVTQQGGEAYSGSFTAYRIASGYAANVGMGDLVKLLATGYINVAAASDRIIGVCVGVQYVNSAGIPVVANNWISGTTTLGGQDATIFVMDDPNVIVEARFSATSLVTNASVGNTFPLVAGTVDAVGLSGQSVDSTTLTATTNQQLRFLGFSPKADNDPSSTSAIGRFLLMNHEFRAVTGV